MKFEEFKKILTNDLLEEFGNQFYVYEGDSLDGVKEQINSYIDSIRILRQEDYPTDEDVERLIDESIDFMWESRAENLGDEDLDYWGELIYGKLRAWAIESNYWSTREIGGIYDEEIGGIYE